MICALYNVETDMITAATDIANDANTKRFTVKLFIFRIYNTCIYVIFLKPQ